jgi:hypothetical protein
MRIFTIVYRCSSIHDLNVYYHIVSDTNGREKLVDMRNRVLTRSCYLISCSRVGLQSCQEKAVVLVRLAVQ